MHKRPSDCSRIVYNRQTGPIMHSHFNYRRVSASIAHRSMDTATRLRTEAIPDSISTYDDSLHIEPPASHVMTKYSARIRARITKNKVKIDDATAITTKTSVKIPGRGKFWREFPEVRCFPQFGELQAFSHLAFLGERIRRAVEGLRPLMRPGTRPLVSGDGLCRPR